MAEVNFYVVIVPVFAAVRGANKVVGAKAHRMTMTEPGGELPKGAVVTKIVLDVPLELFTPIEVRGKVDPRKSTIQMQQDAEEATIQLAKDLANDA